MTIEYASSVRCLKPISPWSVLSANLIEVEFIRHKKVVWNKLKFGNTANFWAARRNRFGVHDVVVQKPKGFLSIAAAIRNNRNCTRLPIHSFRLKTGPAGAVLRWGHSDSSHATATTSRRLSQYDSIRQAS